VFTELTFLPFISVCMVVFFTAELALLAFSLLMKLYSLKSHSRSNQLKLDNNLEVDQILLYIILLCILCH